MTKMQTIIKKDSESVIDSRYKTTAEKETDAVALMEARFERMKNLSKEEILRARLFQLKLQMVNHLKQPAFDGKNYFTSFLESYIDIIYAKKNEFAKDVNVSPVFLSQILNKHREPKEEFISKLTIHSEKVFKNIGEFESKTWYRIYYHKKLCDTLLKLNKFRPEIEKEVKFDGKIFS